MRHLTHNQARNEVRIVVGRLLEEFWPAYRKARGAHVDAESLALLENAKDDFVKQNAVPVNTNTIAKVLRGLADQIPDEDPDEAP